MPFKKYLIALILLFLLTSTLFVRSILSTDCVDVTSCQQRVAELGKQRDTLSAEIQYLDSQINLTTFQIQQTEQKILITQKEIDTIETRIGGLDTSLDYLSKLLLNRIVEGYKNRSLSIFTVLFDSASADDFFSRVKYLKTAQENNQKLLIQVQETKSNFEKQKKLREDKKIELNNLTLTLNRQKLNLNNQQDAKRNLLTITEAEYAKAQAQLAAFKSFVASTGLGVVSADPSWPSDYYSQRDSRWAYHAVGYSSENILNVGCLLTSVSMVLKKNGVNTDPAAIASNTNYFAGNTAWMKYRWDLNPWPNGLNASQISTSQVDDELSQGHYVIVGINRGPCAGTSDHFVVLTKKDGNDYKMYDPLLGPNLSFYSNYSAICTAEVFK